MPRREAEDEFVEERIEPRRSSVGARATSRSRGGGQGPSQSCGLARLPTQDLVIDRSNVRGR